MRGAQYIASKPDDWFGLIPARAGAPRLEIEANGGEGLIPARAGNTDTMFLARSPMRAHPRSRGEHACVELSRASREGSSPLARGTHALIARAEAREGLIPARAGNTSSLILMLSDVRAHPRPCGEHTPHKRGFNTEAGSSPPVRGAPVTSSSPRVRIGLIPARAGSTS